MTLPTFNATHVVPGQPLTAQSWNDIVDAISQVYQFLQATMHTVHVQITNTELAALAKLETVRVYATATGLAPVEAVRPTDNAGTAGGTHVLTGLTPGSYTIHAEAYGYVAQATTVTVSGTAASDTTVSIALPSAGPIMPTLFGLQLATAKQQLTSLQITLGRLLDGNGNDIAPASTDDDLSPVLVQSPPAGTLMSVGSSAQLVIGVPQQVDSGVLVPSLAGLTMDEAEKAIQAVGLVVGTVAQVVPKPGLGL